MIAWSGTARDSFNGHIEYIAPRSPTGARKIVEAINAAVDSLEETPFIGRPGRWNDTRELVVPKYPYIVAYRIKKNVVEILYVHHTRQQWPDADTLAGETNTA